MIRTVTVCAGDSPFHDVAHQHALLMTTLFQGRLRGVLVWEPEAVEAYQASGAGEDINAAARRELKDLLEMAAEAGVTAAPRFQGKGMTDGLLAEAAECDLLVIGMPTEGVAQEDPLAKALLHDELPLLRKAESAVLVVCSPPKAPENVLVSYQGGMEGKAALRVAGHLAEAAEAAVHVLSVHGDLAEAERLAAVASEYLGGYDLPSLQTLGQTGSPASTGKVLDVAEETAADLIVIGDEPYGLLEHFFGEDTAERVALATHTPVLVAR
ncbi:MAG: universal stress protein [Planctomycetota bacterium]